nr:MAG TPA: hypothetical protein [Caudoviricetes sp.]
MIDKILEMYEREMKILASQMETARKNKNMYEYNILSANWDEFSKLFNNTIKIINGD